MAKTINAKTQVDIPEAGKPEFALPPVFAQPVVTHEDDPFLTLSEVGRRIGKSPQTIGRWVQEGLLECERLPTGLRAIRQSAINRFLGGSALKVKAI